MIPTRQAEAGYTLTEMLIATGIMSMTALAVYTLVSMINARAAYLMALETRDVLQSDIVRAMEDEQAVAKTRQRDPIFNSCFQVINPGSPCPGQQNIGVSLYNSAGFRLAGPPNSPAYFTTSGAPCNQSQGSRCNIQVTSTARGQSLPSWQSSQLVAYSGTYHEIVEVRYVVQILDTQLLPDKQRTLSGSYIFDTQDLMSSAP